MTTRDIMSIRLNRKVTEKEFIKVAVVDKCAIYIGTSVCGYDVWELAKPIGNIKFYITK